ncbi:hypothetical protein PAAG_05760 [Paracoccidioides lutzii Pb01]|uniref:Uncharacterized protein n=1 Tax=Paracoccidioides lutzii (strain ATCC MYA-826 / Pb01) TaxID=502779 RepID=C1H4S0_PARBA|nr:hypothetical protein PAAG_05760 [Paracoccidioides lutzii Pb01]EEH34714.1 hypothetical protein PAAG_05760 [Paracoccidioides lutzii Pb01]
MSFLVQDDIDINTRGTETLGTTSSPLHRQLSEPPTLQSTSIQQVGAVDTHPSLKCSWCNESFESSKSHTTSPADDLRQHMLTSHPEAAKIDLDRDVVDETPYNESGLEEAEQATPLEALNRRREALIIEKRLGALWNINDVQKFTDDYDGKDEDLPVSWKKAFGDFERPRPYETETVPSGSFLPITKPEIYIDILKNPESHTTEELYAITANTARALRVWQDEYFAIDKLSRRATRRPLKKAANPRKLGDPRVFEDKKEAMLYGYKHDPRESKIGFQDPFVQGGFKPTPTQLKRMKLNATDPSNIDGWKPITIGGVDYIPGLRPPSKPAPKKRPVDIDTANASGTTNGVDRESDGRPKRITRFGGFRNPVTRESSQVQTEPSTPALSPTSARGKRSKSRAASLAPQLPVHPASPKPSAPSPRTLHPAKVLTLKISTPIPVPSTAPQTPTTPSQSRRSVTQEPASTPLYEDPLLDPKNQLKIQRSKNPKRTEAMIIHWAKFNHEGRTRNPKRTKAQIEADRAEAERKGNVATKTATGRKRRSDSKNPTGAENQDISARKVRRVAKNTLVPAIPEKVEPSTATYPTVQPQPELRRSEPLMGPLSVPTPPPVRYSPYGGQVYQISYNQPGHHRQ